MNLHENPNLFGQAIRFTADKMHIPPIYIEKDYWVTYALRLIFKSEIGYGVVFKGGTSLSKCYKIIERFSEDIDLVLLKCDGETGNHLKSKLKFISNVLSNTLPEIEIAGITRKMGMSRKTVHHYTKIFNENYGQVREVIVLESSWLSRPEPYERKYINSYISEVLQQNDQQFIIEQYELFPFEISVLNPSRTMGEKIMSLVRFSYGDNALDQLKNKIRHIYDLHQLLLHKELNSFFYSYDFEDLLTQVAVDDANSLKNNNLWLMHHPKEAMVFKDLNRIWPELQKAYNSDFSSMVYGTLPKEKDVLESMRLIQKRLNSLDWLNA